MVIIVLLVFKFLVLKLLYMRMMLLFIEDCFSLKKGLGLGGFIY